MRNKPKKINWAEDVATKCRNEIVKFIDAPKETIDRIKVVQDPQNIEYYSLVGGDQAIAHGDHGRNLVVVNFTKDFWLNFTIKFEVDKVNSQPNSYELSEVSLRFFNGYYNEFELLFRAEWSNDLNMDKNHAQPHWHMAAVKSNNSKDMDFSENGNEFDSLNTNEESQFDITRFHFTMISNWNVGNLFKHSFDENSLYKWLGNCLNYIKYQLDFK